MTFEGKLFEFPPAYVGQLQSATCSEVSVYYVDEEGRLMGRVSPDGQYLYPFEIQEGSIVAKYNIRTNDSAAYVSFMFQLERGVKSEDLLTIPPSELGVDLLRIEALIDVTLTATAGATQAATTLYVSARYELYGTFANKGSLIGKTGITPIWWTVLDATGTPVIPTAVTESATIAGDYTITIPSTAAQVVTVQYSEQRTATNVKGYESNVLSITTP